jgi:hypothetical protein
MFRGDISEFSDYSLNISFGVEKVQAVGQCALCMFCESLYNLASNIVVAT